jgi:sialate O-acetylesterase
MLRRFEKLGQPVRGVLWYQGESDASAEASAVYTQKMQELVAATREDFGQPNLPWCVVQIGRVISSTWDGGYWNSIQEQQRILPETIDNLDVVSTIDLELDDLIHISGRDYAVLGERLARIADRLALGNRREKGSIRLKSVGPYERRGALDPAQNALEVTFDNVVGGLRSAGRPVGFSVVDPDMTAQPMLYKTRLEGNKVILETSVAGAALEAFQLAYGFGLDPVCNITDERGMGIPMFGPVAISGQGGTPFITSWRLRYVGELRGGIKKATAPERSSLRGAWRNPHSSAAFLVMPQDAKAARPGIFYLRSTVTAAEEIEALLAFGSDSPFKIWINGEEVAADPNATNPCLADEYRFPVTLQQGANDIIVAFDGRNGQGWGICARFLPLNENEELAEGTLQV